MFHPGQTDAHLLIDRLRRAEAERERTRRHVYELDRELARQGLRRGKGATLWTWTCERARRIAARFQVRRGEPTEVLR